MNSERSTVKTEGFGSGSALRYVPAPTPLFGKLPFTVMGDPDLSSTDKIVAGVLASFDFQGTGRCWPSIDSIAKRCGRSASVIKRALRSLRRAGYITIEPNGSRATHREFQLRFDNPHPAKDAPPPRARANAARTTNSACMNVGGSRTTSLGGGGSYPIRGGGSRTAPDLENLNETNNVRYERLFESPPEEEAKTESEPCSTPEPQAQASDVPPGPSRRDVLNKAHEIHQRLYGGIEPSIAQAEWDRSQVWYRSVGRRLLEGTLKPEQVDAAIAQARGVNTKHRGKRFTATIKAALENPPTDSPPPPLQPSCQPAPPPESDSSPSAKFMPWDETLVDEHPEVARKHHPIKYREVMFERWTLGDFAAAKTPDALLTLLRKMHWNASLDEDGKIALMPGAPPFAVKEVRSRSDELLPILKDEADRAKAFLDRMAEMRANRGGGAKL